MGTVRRKKSKRIRAKANLSKQCPTAHEIVTLLELIMIWWPHPTATAVAIRDGRFLAVGADKERPPGSLRPQCHAISKDSRSFGAYGLLRPSLCSVGIAATSTRSHLLSNTE